MSFPFLAKLNAMFLNLISIIMNHHDHHRENTRREESKYLECENRQLGLSAIAMYILKPHTERLGAGLA